MWIWKKAIETTVARQVSYGEPDYRDPGPTSWLTGRQMDSQGKRSISARKQAQWGQKKSEMMEMDDEKIKNSTNHNIINMAYSWYPPSSGGKHIQI